jgi:hypothetical protein
VPWPALRVTTRASELLAFSIQTRHPGGKVAPITTITLPTLFRPPRRRKWQCSGHVLELANQTSLEDALMILQCASTRAFSVKPPDRCSNGEVPKVNRVVLSRRMAAGPPDQKLGRWRRDIKGPRFPVFLLPVLPEVCDIKGIVETCDFPVRFTLSLSSLWARQCPQMVAMATQPCVRDPTPM